MVIYCFFLGEAYVDDAAWLAIYASTFFLFIDKLIYQYIYAFHHSCIYPFTYVVDVASTFGVVDDVAATFCAALAW
jgi:hypothetical protein